MYIIRVDECSKSDSSVSGVASDNIVTLVCIQAASGTRQFDVFESPPGIPITLHNKEYDRSEWAFLGNVKDLSQNTLFKMASKALTCVKD